MSEFSWLEMNGILRIFEEAFVHKSVAIRRGRGSFIVANDLDCFISSCRFSSESIRVVKKDSLNRKICFLLTMIKHCNFEKTYLPISMSNKVVQTADHSLPQYRNHQTKHATKLLVEKPLKQKNINQNSC